MKSFFRELGAYLKECWRTTLAIRERGRVLFGLLTALLLLPVFLLMGGPIEWTGRGAFVAAAWATAVALLQIFVVSPFIIWRDAQRVAKRRIACGWRFSSPHAELVLRNSTSNSINGIDVKLRNHRKADDTETTDILRSLPSNDGKQAPITLPPKEPMYFRFAELKDGEIVVQIGQTEKRIGQETVVKLSISGPDMYEVIHLHMTVAADFVDIKRWEAKA
jgi:hypothetical protein